MFSNSFFPTVKSIGDRIVSPSEERPGPGFLRLRVDEFLAEVACRSFDRGRTSEISI